MRMLASDLSNFLGRKVVDNTGADGNVRSEARMEAGRKPGGDVPGAGGTGRFWRARARSLGPFAVRCSFAVNCYRGAAWVAARVAKVPGRNVCNRTDRVALGELARSQTPPAKRVA